MATVAKRKNIDPSFGLRLAELREAAGLTQHELAARVGMLQPNLGRLERGGREPGWFVVVRLAKALGVSTEAFLVADVGDHLADEMSKSIDATSARPKGKRK